MKKYLLPLIILVVAIPSIALAVWWNPLSWTAFNFLHKKDAPLQLPIPQNNQAVDIGEQVEKLQNQTDEINDGQKSTAVNKKTVTVSEKTTATTTIPAEWINPAGGFYTPEEVANNIRAKNAPQICKQQYGVHSIVSSQKDSTGNFLCTCENGYEVRNNSCQTKQTGNNNNPDPYGVLYGTGNAYTPEQINAIECAYYKRNCPTVHVIIDN